MEPSKGPDKQDDRNGYADQPEQKTSAHESPPCCQSVLNWTLLRLLALAAFGDLFAFLRESSAWLPTGRLAAPGLDALIRAPLFSFYLNGTASGVVPRRCGIQEL
jgi:hypothetical protein